MDSIYYIESSLLDTFYNRLKKIYKVFSPVVKEYDSKKTDYYYQESPEGASLVYNAYRAVEPLKAFFTYPYERTAEYFTSPKNIIEKPGKSIIFGVKSCDIAGHKIQDFVYLEGVETDCAYRIRRENIIFVSSDCTDFKEVCHCLAWEILPHPTQGFDLNLSPLNDGYLVEVGSKKGQELIEQHKDYFTPAKEIQIAACRHKRESFIVRMNKHILPQGLVSKASVQKLVRDGYSLDTWKQFMLTCVECGGCNLICDTCHCFLLAEEKKDSQNAKVRVWDACQYANFARVAGGANPMKLRWQRLRNRFLKKFDFFIDNLGIPACCGCGRCIEVCPGKIDIREVLKDLAAKLKAKIA